MKLLYKLGDYVKLIGTEEPIMTIKGSDSELEVPEGSKVYGYYYCEWEIEGQKKTGNFHQDKLEPAS